MITPYDTPAVQPRIDTYVRPPFETAMTVIDAKDKRYGEFLNKINNYSENIANIKAASEPDTQYLANTRDKLNSLISDAVAKGVDLSDGYQANKLMSDVKKNVDLNALSNIQKTYQGSLNYLESVQKLGDKHDSILDDYKKGVPVNKWNSVENGAWEGKAGSTVDVDKLYGKWLGPSKGFSKGFDNYGFDIQSYDEKDSRKRISENLQAMMADTEASKFVEKNRRLYGYSNDERDPNYKSDAQILGEGAIAYDAKNLFRERGSRLGGSGDGDSSDGDYSNLYSFSDDVMRQSIQSPIMNKNGVTTINIPKVLSAIYSPGKYVKDESVDITGVDKSAFVGGDPAILTSEYLKLSQHKSDYQEYNNAAGRIARNQSIIGSSIPVEDLLLDPESGFPLAILNTKLKEDAAKEIKQDAIKLADLKNKLEWFGIDPNSDATKKAFSDYNKNEKLHIDVLDNIPGTHVELVQAPQDKNKGNLVIVDGKLIAKAFKVYRKDELERGYEDAKDNKDPKYSKFKDAGRLDDILNEVSAVNGGITEDGKSTYVNIPVGVPLPTGPGDDFKLSMTSGKNMGMNFNQKTQMKMYNRAFADKDYIENEYNKKAQFEKTLQEGTRKHIEDVLSNLRQENEDTYSSNGVKLSKVDLISKMKQGLEIDPINTERILSQSIIPGGQLYNLWKSAPSEEINEINKQLANIRSNRK